jgi:hypothetical protein
VDVTADAAVLVVSAAVNEGGGAMADAALAERSTLIVRRRP